MRIHRSGSLFSQRKIIFVIFSEVHGFCFGRDALTGIVLEFTAGLFGAAQSLLGTKYLVFLQHGAVNAVGAGAFYLFPKQHSGFPLDFLRTLYYSRLGISTSFFGLSAGKEQNRHQEKNRGKQSCEYSGKKETETGLK